MFRRGSKTELNSPSPIPTVIAVVLLVSSFLLMIFRLNSKVQEFRSFLFYWFSPSYPLVFSVKKDLNHFSSRLHDFIQLDRENRMLKEKIKGVSLMEFQYQETLRENVRFKQLLDLKTSVPLKTVAAVILNRESNQWNQTLRVDKGTLDGITSGCPVLGVQFDSKDPTHVHSGVLGRTLQCGLESTQVLLLNDPLSSVACSIARTSEQGLLQGESSAIHLDYLDPSSPIEAGDEVITSGLGGVFPSGLGIGRVSAVSMTRSGFKKAKVEPMVAFNKIKEVLILLK